MKNQKKKKPQKRQLEGRWEYQYKSPQEIHNTQDINDIRTAHQKKKKISRGNKK